MITHVWMLISALPIIVLAVLTETLNQLQPWKSMWVWFKWLYYSSKDDLNAVG